MGLTQKLGTIPLAILTDASNNVGIGAAPSGSYKLEVTGTAKVSSTLLVSGSVTSDDLILTAGTLFGAGNTGFSNRSSDTTLYLQMPATGFNITDNVLNSRFILSSAGALTLSSTLLTGGDITVSKSGDSGLNLNSTTTNGVAVTRYKTTAAGNLWGTGINITAADSRWEVYNFTLGYSPFILSTTGAATFSGKVTSSANESSFGTAAASGVGMQILAGSGGGGIRFKNASNGDGTLSITGTSNTMNYYFSTYSVGGAFVINNNGSASLIGALTQNASDRRLKNNITNIPNALDKIKTLNGVTFNWENNIFKTERTNDIGVIAQEVQLVLPDAVTLAPFDIGDNGNSKSGENYLTVYYEKLIPLLIEGIKELSQQNKELNERLNKAGL